LIEVVVVKYASQVPLPEKDGWVDRGSENQIITHNNHQYRLIAERERVHPWWKKALRTIIRLCRKLLPCINLENIAPIQNLLSKKIKQYVIDIHPKTLEDEKTDCVNGAKTPEVSEELSKNKTSENVAGATDRVAAPNIKPQTEENSLSEDTNDQGSGSLTENQTVSQGEQSPTPPAVKNETPPLEKPEVPVRDVQKPLVLQNAALASIKGQFSNVKSGSLYKFERKTRIKGRFSFRKMEEKEGYQTNPPVLSKSSFLSKDFVEHLMRNKKDKALSVKYLPGDKITNMEGALHTFLTPLMKVAMVGDYNYKRRHTLKKFEKNQLRPVILSAVVQPDFEDETVMATLIEVKPDHVTGKSLSENFKILSAEEKKDPKKHEEYENLLRKHMIYHLTASKSLPGKDNISKENILTFEDANTLLEECVSNDSSETILSKIQGKFFFLQKKNQTGNIEEEKILSLEMLLNVYIEQLRNEFKVLDIATPQGYIYTIDPPAIFVNYLNKDAKLLNRLQICAFKVLRQENIFENLKIVGFNDYADKEAVELLKKAFPDKEIKTKDEAIKALEKSKDLALVIHNNSDGFGQNIEFEDGASLDGVIGKYSDAACVLRRTRSDLLNFVV